MAELLKDKFGRDVVEKIGDMIKQVFSKFDCEAFKAASLDGFEELELTGRARHISHQLAAFLPDEFANASDILVRSLGPKLDGTDSFGMTVFLYLPHVYYAADYGLDDFDNAFRLQYELTQRFTAEFSIRAFIIKDQARTLEVLKTWTQDPSPHVRRLVSEGTRPLLPWAQRLNAFRKDPTPVLNLLELLKDDPDLYVRRSVANNLNDISKDHPEVVNDIAQAWYLADNADRQWLVKHALRGALKKGDKRALSILGYGDLDKVHIEGTCFSPTCPRIGEHMTLSCVLKNTSDSTQKIMLDCVIHFVKANGSRSPKVFKLLNTSLAPHNTVPMKKSISLNQLSTRKHYPGVHHVEWMLNGHKLDAGEFQLVP